MSVLQFAPPPRSVWRGGLDGSGQTRHRKRLACQVGVASDNRGVIGRCARRDTGNRLNLTRFWPGAPHRSRGLHQNVAFSFWRHWSARVSPLRNSNCRVDKTLGRHGLDCLDPTRLALAVPNESGEAGGSERLAGSGGIGTVHSYKHPNLEDCRPGPVTMCGRSNRTLYSHRGSPSEPPTSSGSEFSDSRSRQHASHLHRVCQWWRVGCSLWGAERFRNQLDRVASPAGGVA